MVTYLSARLKSVARQVFFSEPHLHGNLVTHMDVYQEYLSLRGATFHLEMSKFAYNDSNSQGYYYHRGHQAGPKAPRGTPGK